MENNSIHFYVWMYKHGIGICSHLPPGRRTLLRQQSLPSRHTGEWWRPSWIHVPLLDPRDQRGAEEVLTGGGALPRTEVGEELHGSPAEGHGLTAEGGQGRGGAAPRSPCGLLLLPLGRVGGGSRRGGRWRRAPRPWRRGPPAEGSDGGATCRRREGESGAAHRRREVEGSAARRPASIRGAAARLTCRGENAGRRWERG